MIGGRLRSASLVSSLLASTWLAGCSPSPAESHRDPPSAPPPRSVRVAVPELASQEESYPSSLYVEHDVRLRTRRSGMIERVRVDRGDHVKAGQVLAELETDLASAELAMAKAEDHMAEVDYESKRSLSEQHMISSIDFQRAKTARDLAARRVELAEKRLERCYVAAPFDGTVVERWAQVGQRVEEDQDTPLFRVVARDRPRARVDVPESRLGGLAPGAAARIEMAGDEAAKAHPARVVFVSPAVDPASGTAPVIVEAAALGGPLRLGASVRVRFEVPGTAKRPAYRIPRDAVSEGGPVEGGEVTILVAADGHAASRRVRILEHGTGSVVVTGDIGPHYRVIVEGRADLRPGDPVEAVEEAL